MYSYNGHLKRKNMLLALEGSDIECALIIVAFHGLIGLCFITFTRTMLTSGHCGRKAMA